MAFEKKNKSKILAPKNPKIKLRNKILYSLNFTLSGNFLLLFSNNNKPNITPMPINKLYNDIEPKPSISIYSIK